MKKIKEKKKTKCDKNGYHNWVVDSVDGMAPYETLNLMCDDCGKRADARITRIYEVD